MSTTTHAERQLNVFMTFAMIKFALVALALVLHLTGTLPLFAWRG